MLAWINDRGVNQRDRATKVERRRGETRGEGEMEVTLGEREREMNALLVLHDPVTVGDLDPLKGSFGVPGVPEVIQPGLRVVVDWIREGRGRGEV